MTQYVYVVTGLELGWDCVCGVYKTYEGALRYILNEPEHEGLTEEQLTELYEADQDCQYIIHDEKLGE